MKKGYVIIGAIAIIPVLAYFILKAKKEGTSFNAGNYDIAGTPNTAGINLGANTATPTQPKVVRDIVNDYQTYNPLLPDGSCPYGQKKVEIYGDYYCAK